ncbi:hypothetical protein GCM10010232_53980 [Streptomyces amakusaensis]|uniref:DUF6309 family protein n=1 Tax=Streptomyces amakusaensis TaxID=67271 RepID=A0ABW0ASR3_9ACTN
MHVVSSVTFDEVRSHFRRDHPVDREHEANTNQDAVNALELADATFGSWSRVSITGADVSEVMLPWHLSEGGGCELVPRSGLTVGGAVRLLRSREAEWSEANPVCRAKLDRFRDAPPTSIYLSTLPLPHEDYSGLTLGKGLVHLDGLHRMVSWELGRRLSPEQELTVFVAGDIAARATTGGLST